MFDRRSLSSAIIFPLLAIATLTTIHSAWADGLFYKLPPDGASAKYDVSIKVKFGDTTNEMTGSMTMSSVGREEHDGETARWIEVVMELSSGDNEQKVASKMLIPEKHLQPGGSPFENFAKAYVRFDAAQVQEIKDPQGHLAGPLPFFLSGPTKDTSKLDPAVIVSALGSIECQGVKGEASFKQGGGTTDIKFETRLHDRAPFGVVASTMHFAVERGGRTAEEGTITLKLTAVGMDAKTSLPADSLPEAGEAGGSNDSGSKEPVKTKDSPDK